MTAGLMANARAAELYAPPGAVKEFHVMVGVSVSLLAVIGYVAGVLVVLGVSSEVQGILLGVVITLAVALAASVTRLARLALAIAELWLRARLTKLAEEAGVDPDKAKEMLE